MMLGRIYRKAILETIKDLIQRIPELTQYLHIVKVIEAIKCRKANGKVITVAYIDKTDSAVLDECVEIREIYDEEVNGKIPPEVLIDITSRYNLSEHELKTLLQFVDDTRFRLCNEINYNEVIDDKYLVREDFELGGAIIYKKINDKLCMLLTKEDADERKAVYEKYMQLKEQREREREKIINEFKAEADRIINEVVEKAKKIHKALNVKVEVDPWGYERIVKAKVAKYVPDNEFRKIISELKKLGFVFNRDEKVWQYVVHVVPMKRIFLRVNDRTIKVAEP